MASKEFNNETGEWDHLSVTVAANAADLAFLEETRTRLVTVTEGARATRVRRTDLRAQLQQTSRDLEAFMDEGRDLATRIRNGIRTQYGLKAEKLLAFDMQPRRKPQKRKEEEKKKPPEPAQTAPAASNNGTSNVD
ncbi:MAG TPA: hypothetical protein VF756_05160 [Thermoanaerobaculia bacterium]